MVRSHLLYYGELYQAERGFCKHFLSEAITHFTYHRERDLPDTGTCKQSLQN